MLKTTKYIAILTLFFSACTPVTRIQVTRLGFEPNEVEEKIIYALPQTLLKLTISFEKVVLIPGPYAQYGEKYLGLQNCIMQRSENWQINDAGISEILEIDPDHYYVINALTGSVPFETFERLSSEGYISGGSLYVDEDFKLPFRASRKGDKSIVFDDVTVESYVEQRQETMYKTIVTDTSFVQVPVNRTILEKKTHEQKAEEAANFILELRLSRFELLSGYGEVFPDGEAMEATIKKIDQLEQDYLSLFTGKQYSETYVKEIYVTPDPQEDEKQYSLGYFSNRLGFVPASLEEGDPVTLEIIPSGKTHSLRNLMAQTPEEEVYNQLYYRLPDVADVIILWKGNQIHHKRTNIFQLGALVSVPIAIPEKKPLRK